MELFSRLAWALPLVLLLGAAVVLLLKQFVIARPARRATQRMTLRESLTVSEDTRVHLLDLDGRSYLIAESAKLTVIQPATASTSAAPHSSLGASWVKGLGKPA